MRRILFALSFLLCAIELGPLLEMFHEQAQSYPITIINCSTFTTSGPCGVAAIGGGGQPFAIVGSNAGTTPSVSGGQIILIPSGAIHNALSVNFQTFVNVQAFQATYTFIPNGWNIALAIQNNTASSGNGPNPKVFSAGAGCEAGFYQAFNGAPPNKIFALLLDSNNWNTPAGFVYSSAQIYQATQSPCIPNDNQPSYYVTNKVSTSPVPLNNPVNSQGHSTGHTYSATVIYDGANLTLNLFDVTASGSCPGSTCFTQTWHDINIPSLVGANTAIVGLTGGTNEASTSDLRVLSFRYDVLAPPAVPAFSTYTSMTSAGNTPVAAPTFSPAAGSYAGTQSVSILSSPAASYYVYTLSATVPALMPQCDNLGGATIGTKYTGPISIASTQTLYAMACSTRTSLPSNLTHGTFTIGGVPPIAATPVFSPGPGTYGGTQTVTITDSTPSSTIHYTTNGSTPTSGSPTYTGSLTVSTTQTIKAIAVSSGFTNSAVGGGLYTIVVPTAGTPSFTPAAGTYTVAQTVSISNPSSAPLLCTNTTGASIVIGGSASCPAGSTLYTGPITVSSTETLHAVAGGPGYLDSSTASALYTIAPVLATPTFTPGAGTYGAAQTVTIGCASGATCGYTTDGSIPTATAGTITHGTVYTSPVSVPASLTLQAIATQAGHTNSAVASAAYTITVLTAATPIFSPVGAVFALPPTVSMTSSTAGAAIYFTADGTTPTFPITGSTTLYTGPILITMTPTTLKAIAVASGYTNSPVQSEMYTIQTATCVFQGTAGFTGTWVGPCPL